MKNNDRSVFGLGIIAAKKGDMHNPFDPESMKHTWFEEGVRAASNPDYASKDGQLLKDKPLYERGA